VLPLSGEERDVLLADLMEITQYNSSRHTGLQGLKKTVTKRTIILMTHSERHTKRITATYGHVSPNPLCTVHYWKLTVTQVIQNYISLYRTRKYIYFLTSARKPKCLN
jgi:hypothetical protein